MRAFSDPENPNMILDESLLILKSSVPAEPKAPAVPTYALVVPDEFFNDNILGKFYTKDFEAIEFKDPLEISNL